MTKISLIPLTSKCPPQTVFISGIEIRYANCLRHQCHLFRRSSDWRPALVFLLQDWTTVCFWCFFFLFDSNKTICRLLYSVKIRFTFYCERTWNVWLITEWRACLKWAAHDLATQLDRWYRHLPIAAPISVLLVTTAFKNDTRQIGEATLATGAAAQELGVHVAAVAALFKILSCRGVKRTSGGGGGGFFAGD